MKRFPWGLIGLALIAFGGLGRGPSRAAGPEYAVTDLGTLGGDWSAALGINAAGQVVGMSRDVYGRTRAFLWDPDHGMRDLNDLIPPNSPWLLEAKGINEAGWIVGSIYISGEISRAFLVTPGGRVVGTVTDARTGAPLAEVKVKAYNKAGKVVARARTKADGTYALVLPEGTYRLKFKKKRYRAVTAKGVVVTAGEVTEVDVEMRRKS